MDREQSEEERALQEGIERAVYLKLRDTFAAAALTGLLAGSYKANTSLTEKAYELADAMLAIRTLTKETPT